MFKLPKYPNVKGRFYVKIFLIYFVFKKKKGERNIHIKKQKSDCLILNLK